MKIAEMEAVVEQSYGKIPVDDFDALRDQLADIRTGEPPRTLREDYEFYGAEEGVVTAHYRCGCKECGLSAGFEHTVPLPVST